MTGDLAKSTGTTTRWTSDGQGATIGELRFLLEAQAFSQDARAKAETNLQRLRTRHGSDDYRTNLEFIGSLHLPDRQPLTVRDVRRIEDCY